MTENTNVGRLMLDGDATMRTIDATRTNLLNLIERHDVIEIGCVEATQIDIALIQLLLAARRSTQAVGKRLVLAEPAGGALLDVLVRGGFLAAPAGMRSVDEAWWLGAEEKVQ